MARSLKTGDKFIDHNGVEWRISGSPRFGKHPCKTTTIPTRVNDFYIRVINVWLDKYNESKQRGSEGALSDARLDDQ